MAVAVTVDIPGGTSPALPEALPCLETARSG
jgi:hypothetical protein